MLRFIQIFIYLVLSTLVFKALKPYTFCYPQGVHVWAQSDRLSLGMQFSDTVGFMDPRTHSLLSHEGKVGVEFPATSYLASQIAQKFHLQLIPTFRNLGFWWIVLCGLILWLLTLKLVDSSWRWLLIIATVVYSPIIVFYSFSFLPDPWSFGLLLISFGLYFKNKKRDYWLIVTVLLVSAIAFLIKTSSGIYFIGLSAILIIEFIWTKKSHKLLAALLTSLILLSVIYAFDKYMIIDKNKRLWSVIFMSQTNALDSWASFNVLIKQMRFWSGEYLTTAQKIFFSFSLFFFLIGIKRNIKLNLFPSLLLGICTLGVISFLNLFGKQFFNHDYYFIASIHPLLILLVLIVGPSLSSRSTGLISLRTIAIFILVILHIHTLQEQIPLRMGEHYTIKNRSFNRTISNETNWMLDGSASLDSIGIKKEDPILVLFEYSPNVPLVYFERRGLVFDHGVMNQGGQNFEYWFNRVRPKVIIFQNKFLDDASKKAYLKPYLKHKHILDKFIIFETTCF